MNWTRSHSREFQSTPSAWRVTWGQSECYQEPPISIHTLRMEGDVTCSRCNCWRTVIFQSTPSAWRVTKCWSFYIPKITFQSTPSAWRVTLSNGLETPVEGISIHTLRMEGDVSRIESEWAFLISIHTLRMEGDCKSAQKIGTLLFKSNRPAEKLPTGRA